MAAGSSQPSADGLILDVTVARAHALRLGDPVSIAGYIFHVEGFSEETNALAVGRVVFVRRDTAMAAFLAPGLASFVLVKVADGQQVEAVAQAIRAARPGLSVLTTPALVDADRNLFRDLFGVPVNVMAFVGLLVGLLVIGLATYSAAAERTRDFGVLKAIGATNGYLYRVVIEIGVIIGVAGFATGILLSQLLAPWIIHIAPELGLVFEPAYVGRTLAIAMALSLVSALLPAVRIARLDPKDAFA
jgi:putative ABC transport system permease protein